MLNTLNYRSEWIEMINTLPDQNDRNALIAAITMYQFNGQTPTLSPVLNLVFLFIKKEIDSIHQQLKAVEERKEARRAKRTAKTRIPKATNPAINVASTAETTVENKPITESPELPESPELSESPELFCDAEQPPAEKPEKPEPTFSSKNKNFNSILRAKERHDRQKRRKRESIHYVARQ